MGKSIVDVLIRVNHWRQFSDSTPENKYLSIVATSLDRIFSFYGAEYKHTFILAFIMLVKFKKIAMPGF